MSAIAAVAAPPPDMTDEQKREAAVVRKVARRVLPFIVLCYIVAYLDRSNLSVAALTMMDTLSLNSAQFGFAAGIFFLGYILCELPSNLLQVRFGPRRWIARIMISWGILAVCMAFVTGATSLYVMRVLLGIAEAGFFPGIIFYLAFWFPADYRARVFGWFLAAIPISMIIGAPISAALLYMDGIAGMHGWQWLFIIEGLPAVALGIACLFLLTDTPQDATWLDDGEKKTLIALLARDGGPETASTHGPIGEALTNPRMWQMAIVNLGLIAGSYGVVFFLPQMIAEFGASHFENGLISSLPFIASLAGMLAWSWHSDRTGERRWHVVVPMLCSAAGFVLAGLIAGPIGKTLALMIAAAGSYMAMGPFWQYVPTFLQRGKSAAAAIALINMIGSLAGFFAPVLMGEAKQMTGSYLGGLVFTAVLVGIGGLTTLRLTAKRAA